MLLPNADLPVDRTLKLLRQEDEIMTKDVVSLINEHVANGGTFDEACKALATHYEGHQIAINLVIQWVNDLSGNGMEFYENALEHVFKEKDQSLVDALDKNISKKDQVQDAIRAVVSDPKWGPTVKEFTDKFPTSVFSNTYHREIRLMEAGILHAHVRTPQQFLGYISDACMEIFKPNENASEADLEKFFKRVATMSTYDESTTAIALSLFQQLSRRSEDPLVSGVYKKAEQVVVDEAIKVIVASGNASEYKARETVVRLVLHIEFAALNMSVEKDILDALFKLLAPNRHHEKLEGEVKIIRGAYGSLLGTFSKQESSQTQEEEMLDRLAADVDQTWTNTVRIAILCQVWVMDDLIRALFTNAHRAAIENRVSNSLKRKCLSLLLAYATMFMDYEPEDIFAMLSSREEIIKLRAELRPQMQLIDGLASKCESLYPGCPLFMIREAPISALVNACEDKILARGVCIWATEQLSGDENQRSLLLLTKTHLGFLEKIVTHHRMLRPMVINAIWKAFIRDYDDLEITEIESLRDTYIKSLTSMVKIGMGCELSDAMRRLWAEDTRVDMSHLRRFVVGMLECIKPPYSKEFAETVTELLRHERVILAIEKDKKAISLSMAFEAYVEESYPELTT